jgi:hypothetical protein
MVFHAENTGFALFPTGAPGLGRFANSIFAYTIDLPQRFGDKPFTKFDFGESTLRAELRYVTLGITTANEWWGPATTFPYILGNNAPGVPHFFLGTARPVPIGIGRLQARVIYGLEFQSAFSPVQGSTTYVDAAEPGTTRFASGLIATFQPAAIPTLELGFARYFHEAWSGSISGGELRSPFEGLLNPGPATGVEAQKNQEASAFFRWTAPHSGFELYSEYGREDFNMDLRDLELEPDHARAVMFGFRKVFQQTGSNFTGLRAEIFDGSAPSLARNRLEGQLYQHVTLRQGHTEEGQALGADAGVGSMAAAVIAIDRFSPGGSSTWYIRRDTQAPMTPVGLVMTDSPRVLGSIGYQRTVFLRRFDMTAGGAWSYLAHAGAEGGANATLTLQIRSHATSSDPRKTHATMP